MPEIIVKPLSGSLESHHVLFFRHGNISDPILCLTELEAQRLRDELTEALKYFNPDEPVIQEELISEPQVIEDPELIIPGEPKVEINHGPIEELLDIPATRKALEISDPTLAKYRKWASVQPEQKRPMMFTWESINLLWAVKEYLAIQNSIRSSEHMKRVRIEPNSEPEPVEPEEEVTKEGPAAGQKGDESPDDQAEEPVASESELFSATDWAHVFDFMKDQGEPVHHTVIQGATNKSKSLVMPILQDLMEKDLAQHEPGLKGYYSVIGVN